MDSINTAIAISKKLKYNIAFDMKLKTFCYALNELFKDSIVLRNQKDLLIFKQMMQEKIEKKPEISGNQLKIEEYTIKFNKKTSLYKEIYDS